MADKKPRKPSESKSSKSTKPELVTPSQLVKYDPHQVTPINSSSRMTPLGNPNTNPTFSSALVNDYNPFARRSNPLVSSNFIQHPPSTPYFHRYTNLFYIKQHHKNLTNPLGLVKTIFPTNLHFSPSESNKNLDYYTYIIFLVGSINIDTIFVKHNPKKVLYNIIFIIKFTRQQTWGPHPQILKTLQGHLVQYSYYDYIQAWYKVLLHQTPTMSHSWFIGCATEFNIIKNQCKFPMWFIKWWS